MEKNMYIYVCTYRQYRNTTSELCLRLCPSVLS